MAFPINRRIGLWLRRAILALAVAFVLLYSGDWALFELRGTPTARVTVNRILSIPLKGNRQEFDDLGTADQSCALSLFSQSGLIPCWKLRREASQSIRF